jgi:hypothetical protein
MAGNTRIPKAELTGVYGALVTAIGLAVADGRITGIYAIRNPHKLARLGEEAALTR